MLRVPGTGRTGHIAISTGDGGTVEAHSAERGVSAHKATNRRWDYGVLVPGVGYLAAEKAVAFQPPRRIIRLTNPLTRGPTVERVQRALTERGYAPGRIDGVFGPQTASAVARFQGDRGLVADGEVGDTTLRALGITVR